MSPDYSVEAPDGMESGLPTKSEFVRRRTAAKRELESLHVVICVLPMALKLVLHTTLLVALWLSPGWALSYMSPLLTVLVAGLIGSILWSIGRRRQILRTSGWACPGCRRILAPMSPLTWGRGAAAAALCGCCQTRICEPGPEKSASSLLPTREEFLTRRRALRRQTTLLVVIWFAGYLLCAFAMGSFVAPVPPHGAFVSRPLLRPFIILIPSLVYLALSTVYVLWRLKRMFSDLHWLCPSCNERACGPIERATGTCSHCGERIYLRES